MRAVGQSGWVGRVAVRSLLLIVASAGLAVATWFTLQIGDTYERTYRVERLLRYDDDYRPYGLELTGGRQLAFRVPHGMSVDDDIGVRYDELGRIRGTVRHGRYVPLRDQPHDGLFLVPAAIALAWTVTALRWPLRKEEGPPSPRVTYGSTMSAGTVIERARADLASGQPWRARERLRSYLRTNPTDQRALELMGEVLYAMRDLPEAARYWLLTEKSGPAVSEAISAFEQRYRRSPVEAYRALPMKQAGPEDYPPAVSERVRSLRAAATATGYSTKAAPQPPAWSGWLSAALAFLVVVAGFASIVVGFITILVFFGEAIR